MKTLTLGPLEAKIMNYFWRRNCQLSVADVHHHLGRDHLAYTTIATIMGRLVKKGILQRVKVSNEYGYICRQSQEKFKTERSRSLARLLLGSFGDAAIASFVAEVKTDPESLRKLRELSGEGH